MCNCCEHLRLAYCNQVPISIAGRASLAVRRIELHASNSSAKPQPILEPASGPACLARDEEISPGHPRSDFTRTIAHLALAYAFVEEDGIRYGDKDPGRALTDFPVYPDLKNTCRSTNDRPLDLIERIGGCYKASRIRAVGLPGNDRDRRVVGHEPRDDMSASVDMSRTEGEASGPSDAASLQRDPERDFAGQASEVMIAALAALRTFPAEGNYWLRHFPRESCELASWVVGSMLLELGYGDWTLVAGLIDSDEGLTLRSGGHAWLELRVESEIVFSLDATANQFSEWAIEPFVVAGRSPLARFFTLNRRQNLISQPLEWHLDRFHMPPLTHVRNAFDSSASSSRSTPAN